MYEVAFTIQFLQPALGNVCGRTASGQCIWRLPSGPDGSVLFLPSWWRSRALYAAAVLNLCQRSTRAIDWAAEIRGPVMNFRRLLPNPKRKGAYALHEAFAPGTLAHSTAVVPTELGVDAFGRLLGYIGKYRGISPFIDADHDYGLFAVSSITPVEAIVHGHYSQELRQSS